MALLGIIVGLAGGFGAIGFRHLISFFQLISYGSVDEFLSVVPMIPWYFRIGIPALGRLVVGPIVYFLAREAKGHGVPRKKGVKSSVDFFLMTTQRIIVDTCQQRSTEDLTPNRE